MPLPTPIVSFKHPSSIFISSASHHFPSRSIAANKLHHVYSADTLPKQQVAVANLRTEIAQNDELFKRVYKYTFDLARQPQQKSIDLAAAIEYWRTVFAPSGGRGWFSEKTNFLDQWLAYLERDWKKSVNRDMWNMTYEFYTRTLADDSLAWWDEMGAWPSVIDGFAVYLKRQNAGDAPAEQDDNM